MASEIALLKAMYTGLATQLDKVREEKSLMQANLSVQASEIALLKANEKRMMRDGSDYREKVIDNNYINLKY